jgi:hypothetical protein
MKRFQTLGSLQAIRTAPFRYPNPDAVEHGRTLRPAYGRIAFAHRVFKVRGQARAKVADYFTFKPFPCPRSDLPEAALLTAVQWRQEAISIAYTSDRGIASVSGAIQPVLSFQGSILPAPKWREAPVYLSSSKVSTRDFPISGSRKFQPRQRLSSRASNSRKQALLAPVLPRTAFPDPTVGRLPLIRPKGLGSIPCYQARRHFQISVPARRVN